MCIKQDLLSVSSKLNPNGSAPVLQFRYATKPSMGLKEELYATLKFMGIDAQSMTRSRQSGHVVSVSVMDLDNVDTLANYVGHPIAQRKRSRRLSY